jgi:SAM-dependent methyltransferase
VNEERAGAEGGAYVPPGPLERVVLSVREKGALATLRAALSWSGRFLAGPAVAKRVRGSSRFVLGESSFAYVDSWHNWTWLNERAVEIPIAQAALNAASPLRTIEVGAVLPHYGSSPHRIVDKYEAGPGIEQLDIFDLPADPIYDLVLCVSTLEHVGWDEPNRDPELAISACEHLKQLVAPGGELLVTVPVGYHPRLDGAIRGGELEFDEVRALRCAYPSMIWCEVAPASADDAEYDELIYRAEAVLICRWTNRS